MQRLIRGVIANSPAMNTLTIGILVVGAICFAVMRREIFPEFNLDMVLVSVPYPGASPEEIEEGICQKIEEAVQSIDGIKKITSVAKENAGSVVLDLRANVNDPQKVVNDIRSAVDRIPSFPDFAEDPEVQLVTFREAVIKVSILAPTDRELSPVELRDVAEQVRDELLQLPSVSQVTISGALDYQIDIELPEDTLRKHGLSLQSAAEIIRRENVDLPAGTLRSSGQEILVRGKNKRLTGSGIAELPLVTDPSGVVLTVGDLGHVRDEFVDGTAISETNGRASLTLDVETTSTEDLLKVTSEVRDYVNTTELPGGYDQIYWNDQSVEVRGRLAMLTKNGVMGLVLVFFVLAIFLELRLAFWVALGIPISIMGAGAILLVTGQTLNVLSTFSFLMALGIIVDDAIVVGENVFAHRQMNKPLVQAAVDGTCEVLPSVTTSVMTTIIAFCPLLFVTGVMGKFIAVMPLAVIAMLVVSLFESLLILPCHLAHSDSVVFRLIAILFYPLRFLINLLARLNEVTKTALGNFIDGIYTPVLRWSVRNPWTVMSGAACMFLLTLGFVGGGFVSFVVFPKEDAVSMVSRIRFPDGTPPEVTDAATKRIMQTFKEMDAERDTPLAVVYHRSVGQSSVQQGPRSQTSSGSHLGVIEIELVESSQRDVTSTQLTTIWRDRVGTVAGVEDLTFGTQARGPGGSSIEFKLLAQPGAEAKLDQAVEDCKKKLKEFQGVEDVRDDSQPGKWEFQVALKDKAKSMGIRSGDIANTLRASFYGAEVMRLQRGRHEVKLMVRYPPEERHSLSDLQEIRMRAQDGQERPLTELAEIKVVRGYSEINRLNQKRSITITADVDDKSGNAADIVNALRTEFLPAYFSQQPGLSVSWEGQQEQTEESIQSLFRATGVALIVMFALLTFQFKSQAQPFLIMLIIPFGIIGAVFGHWIQGIPLQLFSFFGMVALTGVVVNDSIVLIDFMNSRISQGMPAEEAVIEGARRRFRPVLLTSATTIAGLLPILTETSLEAAIVIPMATSLAFGLLLATALVLILVPTMYSIYRQWVPTTASVAERRDHAESREGHGLVQPS